MNVVIITRKNDAFKFPSVEFNNAVVKCIDDDNDMIFIRNQDIESLSLVEIEDPKAENVVNLISDIIDFLNYY
jgi:hypothetical protein